MKTRLIFLGMAFVFFSCNSNNQNAKSDEKMNAPGESGINEVKAPKLNADSLVKVI